MTASIPASKTALLRHRISESDHPSFLVSVGGLSRLELTLRPRLCDLMSLKGLAYVLLGLENVETFNALL